MINEYPLTNFLKYIDEISPILDEVMKQQSYNRIDNMLFLLLNTDLINYTYCLHRNNKVEKYIFYNLQNIINHGFNISKFIIGRRYQNFDIDLTKEYNLLSQLPPIIIPESPEQQFRYIVEKF